VKTPNGSEIFSLNGKYKLWMFWNTIKNLFKKKNNLKLTTKEIKDIYTDLRNG
jgi:hypothetical protein